MELKPKPSRASKADSATESSETPSQATSETSQSRPVQIQPGVALYGDYQLALSLAVPSVPLLILLALALNYIGLVSPVALIMAVVAAAAVSLIWFIGKRTKSSTKQARLLWVLLVAVCAVQAAAWWQTLLLFPPSWPLAPAALALFVALVPIALRWKWLALVATGLIALPVVGWFPADNHLLPTITLALTALAAVPIAMLSLQRRRLERRNAGLSRLGAKTNEELVDQQRRIRHERDQRQRAERELAKMREVADSASNAKTEFLATMSHEIRTPLNGILPILEMLGDTELNEDQQKYVSTAFNSSRHLLRIIDDILDYAKAESGKLQLESLEIDLRELIEGILELMQSSAQNKGLTLHLKMAEEIPRYLRCDPSRLRQVLINLLSNAIKFTQAGTVRVNVAARRSSKKEVELLFEVVDTGVGMSRETARKLFQSFTQADASTTRKHGGTGLGLAICKRLVNLMGGSIGARSQPGVGSTFWFVLPMRKSQTDVPATRQNLRGVRVLACIPDQDSGFKVAGLLQQWGVVVAQAEPAAVLVKLQHAASQGKGRAFDMLLLDTWGIEQLVLKLLRTIRSDPQLKRLRIALSGRSEPLLERLNMEFNAYIVVGGFRQAPLQTCLHRLMDVEVAVSSGAHWDVGQHLDLNLEREVALQDISPLPESSEGEGASLGRVLLVEDNPVNLGVVKRLLERMGLQTMVAQNGREALDQLARNNVDLVFMDCQMPVMDGYQATRAWRERERSESRDRLPIVAMTANAMAGDREQCIDAGMDDYLAKPVSVQQVQGMLKRWMPHGFESDEGEAAEPTKSANPAVVLDRGVLTELREVMDDGYTDLLKTFLSNTPKLIEQLHQAAQRHDMAAMAIPAHSIKSSSANVGAMQLSRLASEIETSVRRNAPDAALSAHGHVDALFERTGEALRKELSEVADLASR